jgi:hypothetical protein
LQRERNSKSILALCYICWIWEFQPVKRINKLNSRSRLLKSVIRSKSIKPVKKANTFFSIWSVTSLIITLFSNFISFFHFNFFLCVFYIFRYGFRTIAYPIRSY